MAAVRFINPNPQFLDSAGNAVALGSLTFYQTGTTTPITIYSNTGLSVAATNPAPLDASGRATSEIFISDSVAYRVILKDSSGSTIWDRDPGCLVTSTAGSFTNITVSGTASIGSVISDLTMTSKVIKEAKSTNIASASTTDLSTATGNLVHITGTTTITAFGTVQAGTCMKLVFDGALTLTHNATSLILPTSANITTAAGDSAIFESEGSGNWRCIAYQRVSGASLIEGSAVTLTDAASIAVDGGSGSKRLFRVTLAGNRTLAAPTNLIDGQPLTFEVTQDATGSRTLAYDAIYDFPGGTAPVLSTTAAAMDTLSGYYSLTRNKVMLLINKAWS